MRDRIVAFHVFFLLTMLAIIATILMGGTVWLSAMLSVAALLLMWTILAHWMKFISGLLRKSEQALFNSGEVKSKWSFNNLSRLEKNQEIIKNKFEVSAELISNLSHPEKLGSLEDLSSDDPIKKSLRKIREEMMQLKDEDEKQAWVSQGLAKFGEILRVKGDIKEYSFKIISNLAKYVGANQGGFYIEYSGDDQERYLELASCYAYEKRKYVESKIYEGQGLLGQCMLEKDFIFITDVPKDYIKITSGLGFATPRNIVIAPLIFNEIFCGVIELALFDVMKPHQVEFLKKVAENIASEIVTLKNVEKTEVLLRESRELTQELQSREEEMKQNLEELAATQEEMGRKQAELTGVINAIDTTLATIEFDSKGTLIKYNSNLEKIFEITSDRNFDNTYQLITGSNEIEWRDILYGKVRSGDFKSKSVKGNSVWLSVTFTPILDNNGNPVRVLCLIQDITLRKNKEREFERLSLVANNTDNSVIITNRDGFIEYVNSGFTKMTGYEPHEVIGKKPGKLLQGQLTDKATIESLRNDIKIGKPIYQEILNYNKKGESYWVSLAINPVRNEKGETTQFISIQADITQTKIKALDFHQKMEALSRSNAILELDKNGIIVDVNENYFRLLSYQREDLIGKPYSLLTRSESVFGKMMGTIKTSRLQEGTFSRYDKHGNKHYLKLMDYPVLNINGEIEKIIEFGVDVTNEKRLELEAEHKKAELNSYLAGINNTIASAEFKFDGTFSSANDIFLKVMGYANEELQNRNFDFFMGDDQSVVMMWENLRLGKFFSGEFKMKNKEGRELWLTGTFNPILIGNDVPEKIMMFAQFTTQEKEKLNDLNGLVHALKSTLPVVEFTDQFICKTANEKAMKMFGFSRLQLRSKNILDFISPYYNKAWQKKQAEILDQDHITIVLPIQLDNQSINYEVSFSLTRTLEGEVSKVIAIFVKEVTEHVSVLAAV